MAGEKLSPRQQMISLMYLVLLAMLAMQASKDLLDAFTKLESGIDITNDSFALKNKSLYQEIQQATLTGSPDAIEVFNKSQIIKNAADSIFNLIETQKVWLIEEGGGLGDDSIPLGKDNQDIGAEYFITKGEGKALKEKLNEFEALLSSYIDSNYPEVKEQIHNLLETPKYVDPEGVEMEWEVGFSEHMPLAAVTANLSNIQSYVRNAETEVVSYLYNKIKDDLFKFDKLEGMVMSPRAYVMQGDSFSANVFLGAFNTKVSPIIYVGEYDTALFEQTGEVKFLGEYDSIPVTNGIGQYSVSASDVGNKSWKGIIKVPHPNPKKQGVHLYYPFENQYTVAKPSATVSLTKMNTLYRGVPNPIDISVPGIASDKIRARFTRGTLSKQGNGYNAIPNSPGLGKIIVEAEISPGVFQTMGEMQINVRNLPKPERSIPIIKGTKCNQSTIKQVRYILCKYPDFFNYEARPRITYFEMEVIGVNGIETPLKSKNGNLTPDMISRLRNIRRGSTVCFKNIKAKGPDNLTHNLEDLSYFIK